MKILKLPKLSNYTHRGGTIQSALQEVNFWSSMESALQHIDEQLNAPEARLTFDTLKQAKRFLAVLHFDEDTGKKAAAQLVGNVMGLMRDFPISALLSATDITQVKAAIKQIFRHLTRIRTANEYKYERAYMLVSAISRDMGRKLASLLSQQR